MEQTVTATPVGAPDILRNQPLSRQVDVTIETKILEPVSHNFNTSTGGRTVFQLPPSGVLNAPDAAIVFELVSTEGDQLAGYNLQAGGLGCVRRISARCGGNLISSVDLAGHYANIKAGFASQNMKEGVLDARHFSSNRFERRITPQKIAAGSATTSFHQLYNVEIDQCPSFGENDNRNGNNTHAMQASKRLCNVAGRGPEIVIKLSDLFEIFAENKLPLMAMALVEIEIEWEHCGNINVAANNQTDNVLIQADVEDSAENANSVRNVRGTATMTTPNMILDYIHYDDVERQKIVDAVNQPGGMNLNFTEVVVTRGVNPAGTANPGNLATVVSEPIASNHIIGMAQKEVKKIYVQKSYNLFSARGAAEINADFPGSAPNLANGACKTHRNIVLNQFKSTQMPGESYNFFINNQRVYDKDVENPAIQHNYLSQCGGNWSVPQTYYDTMNFNGIALDHLVSTNVENAVSTFNINAGASRRYLSGQSHVIGLSLDKYRDLGSEPGNGTRISNAPIEFNYSRLAVQATAAIGGQFASSTCEVDLTFFICYRRSLVINPLGVIASDA